VKEHDEQIQDLLSRHNDHTQTTQINYAEFTTNITNHTTSIEAIEAKINSMTGGAGGFDMDALRLEFASKQPPENTILRIEALEAELNIDEKASQGELNMSFRSTGGNSNIDLLKRLSKLEKDSVDHEKRIADLEGQIQSLKDIMTGSGGDEASDVPADSKQLANRIKFLADQMNQKADKTELNHQATIYQAKIDDNNDNINRLQQAFDDLSKSLDFLREDYNSFRDKAFESLKDRVFTLEKKFNNLASRPDNNNNSTPIDNDTEQDRSGEYEGGVGALRTELMNLLREH